MGIVPDAVFGTTSSARAGEALPLVDALQTISDGLVALSYLAVCMGIIWLLGRRPDFFREHRPLAWLTGIFILSRGLAYGAQTINLQ